MRKYKNMEKTIKFKKIKLFFLRILNTSILSLLLGVTTSSLINLFTNSDINIYTFSIILWFISIFLITWLLYIQEKINRVYITKCEANKNGTNEENLQNARIDKPKRMTTFLVLTVLAFISIGFSIYCTMCANAKININNVKKEEMLLNTINSLDSIIKSLPMRIETFNDSTLIQTQNTIFIQTDSLKH